MTVGQSVSPADRATARLDPTSLMFHLRALQHREQLVDTRDDRVVRQLVASAVRALPEHDEYLRAHPDVPAGERTPDRLWALVDFATELGGAAAEEAQVIVSLIPDHDRVLLPRPAV